jgi:MATE family multidrug resistance protein
MAALFYMVPLSFSIAISARVSYWRGAGDLIAMKKAMFIGFQLVLGLAMSMAGILFIFHEEIAFLYAKDEAVIKIAAELLFLIGFYHLVDALQTVCFFVLRSFKITLAPMLVYSIMLWGIGLPGGYVLAYHGLWGMAPLQAPHAFWIMSVVALVFVCAGLLALIRSSLTAQTNDAATTQAV